MYRCCTRFRTALIDVNDFDLTGNLAGSLTRQGGLGIRVVLLSLASQMGPESTIQNGWDQLRFYLFFMFC